MENTPVTVPSPDQIRQRIVSCEEELRCLRRLLRLSLATTKANEARQRRQGVKEVAHAS
jgi:hypothetical protein